MNFLLLFANSEQPPWGDVGQVLFCILLFAIVFVPLYAFGAYLSYHDKDNNKDD